MVKRQAGLSLIELMVTVAIIGMLAVVTVPFTSVWLDEAAVNNARSQLHRAHAQAKAVALRNPTAHKLIQDGPEQALEYIGFLSLLAKSLDRTTT